MALLALCVVGCGSAGGDTTIDITFDPCAFDVDPATPGVADALGLWNLTAVPDAPRIEIRFEEAAGNFFGLYDDEHGVVYINARILEPRARAIVLAHELGHAFGLPHMDDHTSVMNSGNFSIEPTVEDRALISSCAPPRS